MSHFPCARFADIFIYTYFKLSAVHNTSVCDVGMKRTKNNTENI